MRLRRLVVGLSALAALAIAGSSPALAGTDGQARWNPANFSARVTNPWFPLKPGTTLVYKGVRDGKTVRDVLQVTHATKKIGGAPCVVVKDRLYSEGKLHERTTDWYTQDKKGNVWYFGETTAEFDRQGHVTSREGSWQAGVNGAVPGIYMTAHPKVGQTYRQEYYKGHAEDHFRVLALHTTVEVPYISSSDALLTKEWTPLEPGVVDHKVYIRGIGTVLEEAVKGGQEHLELVSVTHGG